MKKLCLALASQTFGELSGDYKDRFLSLANEVKNQAGGMLAGFDNGYGYGYSYTLNVNGGRVATKTAAPESVLRGIFFNRRQEGALPRTDVVPTYAR